MGKISKHVCLALGALALLASCSTESSSTPPVFPTSSPTTSKADSSSAPSSSESSAGTSSTSATYETSAVSSEASPESSQSESAVTSESTQETIYYTVTFDLGYEGKSFTQQVEEGKTVNKPENPVRNGYNFLDWVDVNGDHWVFNGYPITKDITLYATWSGPILYTVTFVNNGGTVLDVQTGHYGDTLVYGGATPVAENQDAHYIYTFSGWDGDLVITGDATLTATYEMAYIATTAYYYDYDGTTLLVSVPLAEGEEPHYDGETPTRERDIANNLQFEFEGWDKVEETADSVKFVARYASCTDGLDIEGDTVTYYQGTSTNVIIPSTWGGVKITKIGNEAFKNCSSLASIVIPAGVTSIGHYAFSGCSLSSIVIPAGVTFIGNSAFQNCSSLASISIPEGVASIGNYVFFGCSSLSSVSIPEGVASIGESAFQDCSSLSSVSIPGSVTSVGNYAFQNCSSLASIAIPSSVTLIGYGAFRGCSSFTSIVIPDSVTIIGGYAFYGCSSLSSIFIPDSVTYIESNAFQDCSALTIYCESEDKPLNWSSNWSAGCPVIWGYRSSSSTDTFEYVVCEVDGETYAVITAFLGSPSNAVIPSTVEGLPAKLIAASVLPLKGILESIEIPDGVGVLGDLSFEGFSNLETVALPNSVISIGKAAFAFCSSLSSVSIPDGVASIGGSAFYGCSSLSSVSIPDGVASIGYCAFSGCSSLSSVVIPDSVTSIGESAFQNCSSLTIYCETDSKPSGWSNYWNPDNRPVVWGYRG